MAHLELPQFDEKLKMLGFTKETEGAILPLAVETEEQATARETATMSQVSADVFSCVTSRR